MIRRAGDMGASLLHPSRRVTVTDEVKQPSEEGETITLSQAEARCKRAERVGECTWIVVYRSSCLHDKARDGFRVFAIAQEVRRDSGRPCNGESPKFDPFAGLQFSDVEPHVRKTGLTSVRNREVVLIRGEVADPVQSGG